MTGIRLALAAVFLLVAAQVPAAAAEDSCAKLNVAFEKVLGTQYRFTTVMSVPGQPALAIHYIVTRDMMFMQLPGSDQWTGIPLKLGLTAQLFKAMGRISQSNMHCGTAGGGMLNGEPTDIVELQVPLDKDKAKSKLDLKSFTMRYWIARKSGLPLKMQMLASGKQGSMDMVVTYDYRDVKPPVHYTVMDFSKLK